MSQFTWALPLYRRMLARRRAHLNECAQSRIAQDNWQVGAHILEFGWRIGRRTEQESFFPCLPGESANFQSSRPGTPAASAYRSPPIGMCRRKRTVLVHLLRCSSRCLYESEAYAYQFLLSLWVFCRSFLRFAQHLVVVFDLSGNGYDDHQLIRTCAGAFSLSCTKSPFSFQVAALALTL